VLFAENKNRGNELRQRTRLKEALLWVYEKAIEKEPNDMTHGSKR